MSEDRAIEPPEGRTCCEYCNRDDCTIYAFNADDWCAECLTRDHPAKRADIKTAPLSRPEHVTYETIWVRQTPSPRPRSSHE